jgi:ribosomal protein L12E/L44/L45/RPP1/RPP2
VLAFAPPPSLPVFAPSSPSLQAPKEHADEEEDRREEEEEEEEESIHIRVHTYSCTCL